MSFITDTIKTIPSAKMKKIELLLLQVFAILLSVLYAQDIYAQMTELERLYEKKIQLLEEELEYAISFCITISIVCLLSALYMIFEEKIGAFLIRIIDKCKPYWINIFKK